MNSPSSCIGPHRNLARNASRLAIRRHLFLPFFALHIFLFHSAILTSLHLGLLGGCLLRGTPLTGLLETFIDSSFRSASASWLDNLSASLFINLILFLLNPESADLDVWDIFSLSSSICNFRLLICKFRLVNFLADLVYLALLRYVVTWLGVPAL